LRGRWPEGRASSACAGRAPAGSRRRTCSTCRRRPR
jgi:hypothetical protein